MAERSVNRRRFLESSATATAGAAIAVTARTGSAAEPTGSGEKAGTVGLITHEGGAHLGQYFTSLAQAEEVTSVVLSDPSGKSVPNARKTLGEKLSGVYSDPAVMLERAKPLMALVSMEA